MSLVALRDEMARDAPSGTAQHQRKTFAESWIDRAISTIEAEGRGPDDWESHQLAGAVGSIAMRQYTAAANCVALACAPPEERAEDLRSTTPGVPFSIRDLREGLATVAVLPSPNN